MSPEDLRSRLASPDEDERYEAVGALDPLREAWVAPLLRRTVAVDPCHAVQRLALEQLAHHPSEETRRFLVSLLPESQPWSLTRLAATLLAAYPSDDTVDALVPLLDYFDVYTREAVIVSLTKLARPRLAGLLHALLRTELEERAVREALRALDLPPGPPEQDPLLRSLIARSEVELGDPDPALRERALRRLVIVRPADLAERLLAGLDDPDEGLRSTAAYELHGVAHPRVVPALLSLLRGDEAEEVRSSALRALRDHPGPEVLARLLDLAVQPEVRASASMLCDLALALGGYPGPRATEALVRILLDHDVNVVARNTAADQLLERNAPALAPVWAAVAAEDSAAGSSAREALAALREGLPQAAAGEEAETEARRTLVV